MRQSFFVIVFLMFCLCQITWADEITLTSPETLSSPTAAKIGGWIVTKIDATNKVLQVQYRWLGTENNVIHLNSVNPWYTWTCRDIVDDPETPENEASTCFSDVFGFQIRAQDVGTKIGVGLRTLIWNKFKTSVIPGNDGTFDTN